MNDPIVGSDASLNRFDRIEAILSAYPDVTDGETDLLKHWFRKEASAFEVASLASKEICQSGYRQFSADHLDRFTAREWTVVAMIFASIACAVVAYVLYAG